MTVTDLPLAVLLLLPGFVFLHIVFVVSRVRRMSAFYATTWSLLISLLLFVIAYWPFTLIFDSPSGAQWPGIIDALAQPTRIPNGVWPVLYTMAVLLGVLAGVLEDNRLPERILLKLGLDVGKHSDLWERTFREERYKGVRVYLREGILLQGWPKYFSDDRSNSGAEIYLSNVHEWDFDDGQWNKISDIDGVLLHDSEILRIEFLPWDGGSGIAGEE